MYYIVYSKFLICAHLKLGNVIFSLVNRGLVNSLWFYLFFLFLVSVVYVQSMQLSLAWFTRDTDSLLFDKRFVSAISIINVFS